LVLGGLFEVVSEFLVFGSIINREFEFAFFGPQNDRLPFHPADHIEGSFGFTAQGHFQQVFFHARFHGFTQFGGDFEVTIRGAEAFNALMGPFVVVIFDPEADALASRFEALELGAGEELLPDTFPEALDLAQRHRMMRAGLEVMRPVLFHLGLEASGAAPVDVLATIVGEHLLGGLILGRGDAENFEHVLSRVAAEQIGAHDEARVIIHEADEIRVAATEPEGEDVGLPHLVGGGPLKEARPHQVAPRFGSQLHQTLLAQDLAHRPGAGRQEEHPAQQLRDPLDPAGRLLLFEFEDLLAHRLGEPGPRLDREMVLEALLALVPIALGPLINRSAADAQLAGDQFLGKALFEMEFDGAQTFFEGERHTFSRQSAPRGGGVVVALLLLLCWFILFHLTLLFH